jgi:[acyl-carrier-protein] S-malonyltransferase
MGEYLFNNYPEVRDAFEEAGDVLAINLKSLCFNPSQKEALNRLENAQVALVALSVGMYGVYRRETGVEPFCCLGHSLGEYSALCCAGGIAYADVLRLVRERGAIINRAASALQGTMMWVINQEVEKVEQLCREALSQGNAVYVSAYDTPFQCSISGATDAVVSVARTLEKMGALIFPLKLSGPFHSPLMQQAAAEMSGVLAQYRYHPLRCPVIANRNAAPYQGVDQLPENLARQLVSPVRWKDSLDYLVAQGVTTAVEIGPKDVLQFLVKKNTDRIRAYPFNKADDVQAVKETLRVDPSAYLQIMAGCLGVAVSCKNRNPDPSGYQQGIVEPYRAMEALYHRFKTGAAPPPVAEVRQSVALLKQVLAHKQVSGPEQQQKVGKLLQGKGL